MAATAAAVPACRKRLTVRVWRAGGVFDDRQVGSMAEDWWGSLIIEDMTMLDVARRANHNAWQTVGGGDWPTSRDGCVLVLRSERGTNVWSRKTKFGNSQRQKVHGRVDQAMLVRLPQPLSALALKSC
jgi:hypothetical protein